MFDGNALMPTMPPPGSVRPGQQGAPAQVDVPKVAGRRRFIHPRRILAAEAAAAGGATADAAAAAADAPAPDGLDLGAFAEPQKRITEASLLREWTQSEAYLRILDFIQSLNESVRNKKVSDPCPVSEAMTRIIQMLDEVDGWIDQIPPEPTPQRFGNISFRKWALRLKDESVRLTAQVLPQHLAPAATELAAYLAGGFGDGTRIDYGSGHELAFTAWLCCLELLDVFGPDDYQGLVTRVFVRYLDVVRRLQRVYMLEPAGSHGVWGLDDHQFLPYFWGSSQLMDHPRLRPKSITQRDIVSHFSREYLYLACIDYINEVKRGPFHEHSSILYDISGVPAWAKVNSGMLKMYIAEVLQKHPVVQHFLFGRLLPFEPAHAVALPAPPSPVG
ncbi:Serine/threonine-protein phosphatase 2A activator 1 [Polyrhizophydium stewartii]|uniref:Serine/threonine-protein phosphatase 2A activator n=1 Tax=Polyrhizophydium stewartii TaxID=2732419 RepID=A0ABR4N4R9_9FUNG